MLYAIGRRNLVHPSLGRVHAQFGTPSVAIGLMALISIGGAMIGDAILVPITEVGSLTVGVGWLSACAAYILRARPPADGGAITPPEPPRSLAMAWLGAAVSVAIILMKVIPVVPGSFTRAEWLAFAAWSTLGLVFWLLKPART